ncbi:MAG: hypothetical protein U0790_04095 [Isosphaeraceae bacterium]
MPPFDRQPDLPETSPSPHFPDGLLSAQPLTSPSDTPPDVGLDLVRTLLILRVVYTRHPLAHAAALNEIAKAFQDRTLDHIQAFFDGRWSRGYSLRVQALIRARQCRPGPLSPLPPTLHRKLSTGLAHGFEAAMVEAPAFDLVAAKKVAVA